MEGLYPSRSRSTVFGSFYYVTTFVCRLFPFSLFPRPPQPALPWFHGESNTYSFKLTYSVFRLQAYLCHGMSSNMTWRAKTSSEGSVVSRKFFFSFSFTHQIVCAGTTQWHPPRQWQPHNDDTTSTAAAAVVWAAAHHCTTRNCPTATRRAAWRRQRRRQCGQQHTGARLATARWRHDERRRGDTGSSSTVWDDSQLPDGDTTSSAAATRAAAAQRGTALPPDGDPTSSAVTWA